MTLLTESARENIGRKKNKTGHQESQAAQDAEQITVPDGCCAIKKSRYDEQ